MNEPRPHSNESDQDRITKKGLKEMKVTINTNKNFVDKRALVGAI